jgi:hypothetical protein
MDAPPTLTPKSMVGGGGKATLIVANPVSFPVLLSVGVDAVRVATRLIGEPPEVTWRSIVKVALAVWPKVPTDHVEPSHEPAVALDEVTSPPDAECETVRPLAADTTDPF